MLSLIIDLIFFLSNQSFLTEEALKAVKELLPETAEGDLASVCSWPDEIKHRYNWRWTSELHYVDTPDFRCNYDYCSKFYHFPSISSHLSCFFLPFQLTLIKEIDFGVVYGIGEKFRD